MPPPQKLRGGRLDAQQVEEQQDRRGLGILSPTRFHALEIVALVEADRRTIGINPAFTLRHPPSQRRRFYAGCGGWHPSQPRVASGQFDSADRQRRSDRIAAHRDLRDMGLVLLVTPWLFPMICRYYKTILTGCEKHGFSAVQRPALESDNSRDLRGVRQVRRRPWGNADAGGEENAAPLARDRGNGP